MTVLALGFDAPCDATGVEWRRAGLLEVNDLLRREHYLGPVGGGRLVFGGYVGGELVAAQVWSTPTSRRLPADGSWLELARWCLTAAAGAYAGSRMHAQAVRTIKAELPDVRTLVSYSDPSQGHTGALYRSCNWLWAPTWHRLRPPPTANGTWGNGERQAVKDRWVFRVRRDPEFVRITAVDDPAAVRSYLAGHEWATVSHRWPSVMAGQRR